MNRHTLMLTIAILWFFVIANVPLYATHCQIHGSVNRGSQSGPGLAGWKIVKTPVEGFGMDTVTTDVSGNFQFTLLPGNVTYRIHPIVPIGWFPLDAIAGVNTVNGDSGEVSTSTKIDEMTLDVFVKNGTVNSNNQFIVATSTDTTKYRTARYLDWASTYGGGFQVRKAVKCKFDEAELKLNLVVPRGLEPLSKLELKFNVGPNFLLALWSHAKGNKVPLCYASATNPDAVKFKLWAIDLNCPQTSNPPSADDTVQFDFHGLQGKLDEQGSWLQSRAERNLAR
ncbi:MAG: hypothetical protein HY277_04445 [Ignavibacteriales bacterium]|nr:hypothetical protein [Ignavibacteriales bacterium]